MRHAPKPPLAVLAGFAVGPLQIIFPPAGQGANLFDLAASDIPGIAMQRIATSYIGFNPVTQGRPTIQEGGWWGTLGIAGGVGAHYLANLVGLNRLLARHRWPFRI